MNPSRPLRQKKDLLLCFDAFGTLFHPKEPVPSQYGRIAARYGIDSSNNTNVRIQDSFKQAYKHEAKEHPNYGKAVGMEHEKWWANVISQTFQPFLKPSQSIPQPLIQDILTQFSTSAGYSLYPDVVPFFRMLREVRSKSNQHNAQSNVARHQWRWSNTTVGIITNSDSRVPDILSSFGFRIGPHRYGQQVRTEEQDSASEQYDVDFVVLSYDVGHSKPAREIFDAATSLPQELGLTSSKPTHKLFVGDSLDEDYFASREAGWDALLLDRRDHKDHLEDTPILRYNLKEAGKVKEVDVVRDFGALKKWSPVNYLVRGEGK